MSIAHSPENSKALPSRYLFCFTSVWQIQSETRTKRTLIVRRAGLSAGEPGMLIPPNRNWCTYPQVFWVYFPFLSAHEWLSVFPNDVATRVGISKKRILDICSLRLIVGLVIAIMMLGCPRIVWFDLVQSSLQIADSRQMQLVLAPTPVIWTCYWPMGWDQLQGSI